MNKDFMTKLQLAVEFGVHTATIQRWIKKGLPTKKLGYRTYRFNYQEVKEWIDENKLMNTDKKDIKN